MSFQGFENPTLLVPLRLETRNKMAQALIEEYKGKHAAMDVGVGLVGLFPGAGIPALIFAIASGAPLIYQPLAKKLAEVYLASPSDLDRAKSGIIFHDAAVDIILGIGADFGVDFISQIATEMLTEVGLGVALSFIPILGAVASAGMDYIIATKMTDRVGKMVSIYFQNGGRWRGTQRDTYRDAKNLSGDLNSIRRELPGIRDALISNLQPTIEMMRDSGVSDEQLRQALIKKDVPIDLIDEALRHH